MSHKLSLIADTDCISIKRAFVHLQKNKIESPYNGRSAIMVREKWFLIHNIKELVKHAQTGYQVESNTNLICQNQTRCHQSQICLNPR